MTWLVALAVVGALMASTVMFFRRKPDPSRRADASRLVFALTVRALPLTITWPTQRPAHLCGGRDRWRLPSASTVHTSGGQESASWTWNSPSSPLPRRVAMLGSLERVGPESLCVTVLT